jgi:dihydrofolate synthase/folylpolyglutamate synthase
MSRSLAEWLDYQQTVHVRGVDLGLARSGAVWQRMGARRPAPLVITVGGTNGKGSTVAFLDAMLRAMGRSVGCYTSPHLLRYNERVRLDGRDASDDELIAAFERIEAARGDTPLTYFEYGTLAAFELFAGHGVDVAVLEVGLGGRLDAVNLVDADVAIVTTIDLDHQDWLGPDRDSIGREKAGIFRVNRPAVIGELAPPRGLLDAAAETGAAVLCNGVDFGIATTATAWSWRSKDTQVALPLPHLDAPSQRHNAAAAIAALHALRDRLGWDPAALARGCESARIPGRLQRFRGSHELLVDVAHNPQAARELAAWLQAHPIPGRNLAVFGALADKDVAGIVEPLAGHFASWSGAALDQATPRGRPADDLRGALTAQLPEGSIQVTESVAAALDSAASQAAPGDRILAFGSFFVAAAALEWARQRGLDDD